MTLITRLRWNAIQVNSAVHAATVRGLKKGTEHILGESRKQVPLEEGTLERSGVASVDETSLTGAVSYDTVYAVRQHEELDWRHAPGRKAKYLEDPFTTERETALALIAAEVRRALRG